MIRTLLIITGASLVLCIAALAGAAALGGSDIQRHGWTWTIHDDGEDHTIRFDRSDDGPAVTRELAWTGGDRLQVEIPGDVVYVQGPLAPVVVTGQGSMVDRVRIVDGRLTYDDGRHVDHVTFGWNNHDRLRVTITAPDVSVFDVESSADLSIRNYDQPNLTLSISGSSDVEAAGKADRVNVDISGSGDADLSAVAMTDASVDISGAGHARLGPTGAADISISGSGDVDLTRRPASLTQNVSGSGDVEQE